MAASDLSVIIPTRNRATILKGLLETVSCQETGSRFRYEVVVVDNGSSDDTSRMVEGLTADYPVPLRCVVEPRPGKPFAANTGIAYAQSDLLVFTDDDVLADPGWLSGIWRCFEEAPDTEAVAGRILPLWIDGRPEWMSDQIMGKLGTLGCLNFGPDRLVISQSDRHYWWVGSNVAVRRSVVERFGGFDLRRARGQDVDLFDRYNAAGVKIVYEPRAVVRHKVGQERLTPEAFRAWYDRQGFYRGSGMTWRPHHLVTLMPLHCYQQWWFWAKRWWQADRSPEAFWERLSYECRTQAWNRTFLRRLQLWPRCVLTMVTGRSFLPDSGVAGQANPRG